MESHRLMHLANEQPIAEKGEKRDFWLSSRAWLMEVLSMATSLCGTAALALMLAAYKDKPISAWTFYFSISSIVSTLTTVIRVALLLPVSTCLSQAKWMSFRKTSTLNSMDVYDEASRGSFGAVKLLAQAKSHSILPAIASIVTVLALAIGPITQQVVQIREVDIPSPDASATFPHARSYDSGAIGNAGSVGNTGAFSFQDNTTDRAMRGAMLRGLYADESQWTPAFKCSTNCTWPGDYTILGFDSVCENVTLATLSNKRCQRRVGSSRENCTMTTPNNVTIETTWFNTVFQTSAGLSAHTLTGDDEETSLEIARIAFYTTNRDNALYAMGITGEAVWDCSLKLAAWKRSNVSSTLNSFAMGAGERAPLEAGRIVAANPDDPETFNEFRLTLKQPGFPDSYLNTADVAAMRYFFTSPLFAGYLLEGESQPAHDIGNTIAFLDRDPGEVMKRVAEAMTVELQRGDMSELAVGYSRQHLTYFEVDWMWLILLACLQATTVLILITNIVQDRKYRSVPLWKSSQSALVYYSLDSDELLRTPISGPRELEQVSRTTRTRLA